MMKCCVCAFVRCASQAEEREENARAPAIETQNEMEIRCQRPCWLKSQWFLCFSLSFKYWFTSISFVVILLFQWCMTALYRTAGSCVSGEERCTPILDKSPNINGKNERFCGFCKTSNVWTRRSAGHAMKYFRRGCSFLANKR